MTRTLPLAILFPGSGSVGMAWEAWLGQLRMSA